MSASPPDRSSTTRQRLLEAAFEVFAEKGYSGTRVQEIAKRAGFTTGAIYANFNGKAALLGEAIGSQGASALQSQMKSVRPGEPAGRLLRDLGVLALVDERKPVDTLLLDALAAAARDPEVAAIVQPHLAEWRKAIEQVLERSHERGDIRGGVSPAAITTLCSAIGLGSFVLRALDLPRAPEPEIAAVMNALVGAFAVDDGGRQTGCHPPDA